MDWRIPFGRGQLKGRGCNWRGEEKNRRGKRGEIIEGRSERDREVTGLWAEVTREWG